VASSGTLSFQETKLGNTSSIENDFINKIIIIRILSARQADGLRGAMKE